MTDQISDAARSLPPAAPTAVQTDEVHRTLDGLTVALEAAKLAVETALEGSQKAGFEQPAPADILERWRVANLLVDQVFDNLYFEVRHAIGVVQAALPTD